MARNTNARVKTPAEMKHYRHICNRLYAALCDVQRAFPALIYFQYHVHIYAPTGICLELTFETGEYAVSLPLDYALAHMPVLESALARDIAAAHALAA